MSLRTTRWIPVLALAPCVVGGGCSSSGPEAPGSVQAGELVVEQRFGGEAFPLTRVYLIAAGPGGFFALADGPPARVVLVPPDGTAIPIGASGLGPSEYGYVNQIGFAGDSLWVTDARRSKAMFFDLDGEFLGSVRISIPSEGQFSRPAGPIRPLADGSWLAAEPSLSITGVTRGWVRDRPFLRYSESAALDTIFVEPLPQHDFMRVSLGDDRFLEGMHPVQQRPLLVADPDGAGFWIVDRPPPSSADSAQFTIHRLNLSGDTTRSALIGYAPVRVPENWKSSWYSARATQLAEVLSLPVGRVESAFQEAVPIPDFLPPILSAQSGVDGRLWLREWTLDTLSSQWLILDSAGSPEGRLHAPSGFRLLAADSASVFGVLKDELDVETVIRGSVRASAPGGGAP